MQNEIWKESIVHGYEVSSIGRMRYKFTNRIRKERIDHHGYSQFVTKHKSYRVHRLVALAFIPNEEGKPQINHKNGVKADNRVENLEWCTQSENQIHAVKNGLQPPQYGELNPRSKLTESQVNRIRKEKGRGIDIAQKYNVSMATVSVIRNGKSWKCLNP